MKTLYILRKTTDPLAMEAMRRERRERAVALLLIQDGVLAKGDFPKETYLCAEDLTARGISVSVTSSNHDPEATVSVTSSGLRGASNHDPGGHNHAQEVRRPYATVTYTEIARLISESDRVIVW